MAKGDYIRQITPEQRAEALRAAQAARTARSLARARSTVCRDWPDNDYWTEAARARKIRLPNDGDEVTPAGIRAFLRKIDRSLVWYYDHSGFSKIGDWQRLNPDWSMRACAGILLEWLIREEELAGTAAVGTVKARRSRRQQPA